MSRKLSDEELDGRRCTAKAKSTGERCRRWALRGYNVCMMHGAGTRLRLEKAPDGRVRRSPGAAALKHGGRSGRLRASPSGVGRYAERPSEELLDIRLMAARLWVAVEDADSLCDSPDPAEATRGHLIVTRVIGQLARLVVLYDRAQNRRPGVPHDQVVNLLLHVLMWLEEDCRDPVVKKSEVPDLIVQRLRWVADDLGLRGARSRGGVEGVGT